MSTDATDTVAHLPDQHERWPAEPTPEFLRTALKTATQHFVNNFRGTFEHVKEIFGTPTGPSSHIH